MRRKVVTCGFSESELSAIDDLVSRHIYCSRSDAIRQLTCNELSRKGLK